MNENHHHGLLVLGIVGIMGIVMFSVVVVTTLRTSSVGNAPTALLQVPSEKLNDLDEGTDQDSTNCPWGHYEIDPETGFTIYVCPEVTATTNPLINPSLERNNEEIIAEIMPPGGVDLGNGMIVDKKGLHIGSVTWNGKCSLKPVEGVLTCSFPFG